MSTLATVCPCRVAHVGTKGICTHVPCLYPLLTRAHVRLIDINVELLPESLSDVISALKPHLVWINHTRPASGKKRGYTTVVFDFFQPLPKKQSFKQMLVGKALQQTINAVAREYQVTQKLSVVASTFVSVVHSPEEVEAQDGVTERWAVFRVSATITREFSHTLVDILGGTELDGQLLNMSLIYFDKVAVEAMPLLERAPVVAPGRCIIKDMSGRQHVREDTPHPDFAPPGLTGAPVYPRVQASGEEKEEKVLQPLMPPPTTGVTTDPDFGPSESLTKLSLGADATAQAVAGVEEDVRAELNVVE